MYVVCVSGVHYIAPSRGGAPQLGETQSADQPSETRVYFKALALRTRTPRARALLPVTRSRSSGLLGALLSSPALDVRLITALQVLQVLQADPQHTYIPHATHTDTEHSAARSQLARVVRHPAAGALSPDAPHALRTRASLRNAARIAPQRGAQRRRARARTHVGLSPLSSTDGPATLTCEREAWWR